MNMNNTLVKSILAGLLIGVAIFIMPFFLLRLAVFLLIISALFRLFGGGRFRRRNGWRGRGFGYMPAFADRIRQMSDEEYNQFKQRHANGHRGNYKPGNSTGNSANENSVNS